MKPSKVTFLASLAALSFVCASCDPLNMENDNKLGLTITEGGVPVVLVQPCADEVVQSVSLVDMSSLTSDGSRPVEYLWRTAILDSAAGEGVRVPIDDSPPPGMTLKIPLAVEMAPGVDLLASYSMTDANGLAGGGAREFHVEDLTPGEVMTRSDSVSFDEFMDVASGACPAG